jgi:NAD+ kinase
MNLPAEPRIAFVSSGTPEARHALEVLTATHRQHEVGDADVICALGGDGFMLQTLHQHGGHGLPVYGMKLGSVGFLMNHYHGDMLLRRLHAAEPAVLRPLEMHALTEAGHHLRCARLQRGFPAQANQADGAYPDLLEREGAPRRVGLRRRARGHAGRQHRLQLFRARSDPAAGAAVIALTPIAAFRPRRWRGAILRAETEVKLEILDPYKRPVSATADSHEVRNVVEVRVRESRDRTVTLLFDPEHNLEERILDEQFVS